LFRAPLPLWSDKSKAFLFWISSNGPIEWTRPWPLAGSGGQPSGSSISSTSIASVIHGEYLNKTTAERVGQVIMEYLPVSQVVEQERMRVMRLSRDHDRLALWTADAYDFDFGPSAPRFFVARGWWPSELVGPVGMAWSHGQQSTLGFFLPDAWALTMELRLIPLFLFRRRHPSG
jgi:hypothetical protein